MRSITQMTKQLIKKKNKERKDKSISVGNLS